MNADKVPEGQSPYRPVAFAIAMVAGLLAAMLRVVPHPPNFSSVGALGIFGGARLRTWQAYLLPLGIMLLSDLALWTITGFNDKYSLTHISRVYVYASFMIYVFIGRCISKQNSIMSVALAAVLGGLQFFVVTNFCEWLFQPWQPYYEQLPEAFRYSRDVSGLAQCFLMALPFYQTETPVAAHPFMLFSDLSLGLPWTIIGDVFFSIAFFAIHERLAPKDPVLAEAPAGVEVPS
jgi:hypothetical protein